MARTIKTNDGTSLAYEQHGETGPILVLIHGWSGSRRYFSSVFEHLAGRCRVYALDLRHHGDSGRPSHGLHVARLAADLNDFLTELRLTDVCLLGASMGAAVIWSYIENYRKGFQALYLLTRHPCRTGRRAGTSGQRAATTPRRSPKPRGRPPGRRRGDRRLVPVQAHRPGAPRGADRRDDAMRPARARADNGRPHAARLAPRAPHDRPPVPQPRRAAKQRLPVGGLRGGRLPHPRLQDGVLRGVQPLAVHRGAAEVCRRGPQVRRPGDARLHR
eukprot:CAMPEP_0177605492 /NCGR_PEP_ID=MMETSP0419_2-20121207/16732_1 /TAXON_ID=582737 /ORGANISM="Tetraselmis sp., Strain GSL018" /LENGTH=273 /DNA_ID=CAMNT_0019099649 /DNA_START=59 /DNA_END=877 /DNA_ORIENTATION=+